MGGLITKSTQNIAYSPSYSKDPPRYLKLNHHASTSHVLFLLSTAAGNKCLNSFVSVWKRYVLNYPDTKVGKKGRKASSNSKTTIFELLKNSIGR